MRFLGLDLGTSHFKGAVLDPAAGTVARARRVPTPGPVAGLPAGHHELDPAAVLGAVRRLIDELLADTPDAGGLVLCGQMHCVVLTDAAGRPRSNVITWKDQRGAGDLFAELQRRVTPDERREIGGELRIGLPVVTLSWLRAHGQLEPDLVPASLPDFVLSQLCGVPPTTEPTNAAAHGLYHLGRGDWHHGLIARLGLADQRWPVVRRTGEAVGTAELAGRRLTCFTPVGDQQCALLGAELAPRELSLNISTGSQVSLLADNPGGDDYQVRPYFDGQWLRTIVQVPAGRSLGVLVNLLTQIPGGGADPWEYIARESERVEETDLEVNLAFFAGPFGSSGSVTNIREDNLTVGHLFAAGFLWMAGNYARCAGRLSPDRAWDRVVFSGGLGQRFGRLRRETLSRLGDPPWRLCPTEEDTLRGLMRLAASIRA